MRDKQRLTGAANLWLPLCINWRWFIQVFILIARPPSQLKYIWGECHGIKGSAQDSGAVTGCQRPVVGTETRGLSYQRSGCQARRKERATAAALAGREQKQALNAPALWTFTTFVYVKFPLALKPGNNTGPFSPLHPQTQLLLFIWLGRKEAVSVGNGYFQTT